jgi:hypothetical protein
MFRNKPNTLKALGDSNPKYFSTYHGRGIQYVVIRNGVGANHFKELM